MMTSTGHRLVAVLAILLATSPAAAQDPGPTRHRLALLSLGTNFPGEAWPEVEQRVAAELEVMGFEVVAFDATNFETQGRMQELAEIASALQAFAGACISFEGGAGTIRVWLDDEGADRQVERSFGGDRVHDADAVARIGLSAAELLQAVLLEDLLARSTPATIVQGPAVQPATGGEQPPQAPPEPAGARLEPAPRERPAERAPEPAPAEHGELRRWRIWGALGASIPFDPLYGQGLVTLGGGLRIRDWLSVDFEASVTVSPNVIDIYLNDAVFLMPGSMVFSQIYDATLRVQLAFHPWPRSRTVRPAFGLGAGMFVAWHRATYYPADGSEATLDGSSVAGLFSASARFDIPVSRRALVFVGATVGIAAPYTTIFYFQHAVATVGIPVLETVVGVEWGLGRPLTENR